MYQSAFEIGYPKKWDFSLGPRTTLLITDCKHELNACLKILRKGRANAHALH